MVDSLTRPSATAAGSSVGTFLKIENVLFIVSKVEKSKW
jgi:hypothetical protein